MTLKKHRKSSQKLKKNHHLHRTWSHVDTKSSPGPQYDPPGPSFWTSQARKSILNRWISDSFYIKYFIVFNSMTFPNDAWNLHVACIIWSRIWNIHLKIRITLHNQFPFPTPGLAGSRERLQLAWITSNSVWDAPWGVIIVGFQCQLGCPPCGPRQIAFEMHLGVS